MTFLPQQVHSSLVSSGQPVLLLISAVCSWDSSIPFSSGPSVSLRCISHPYVYVGVFGWKLSISFIIWFCLSTMFHYQHFPLCFSLSFELTNKEKCMPTCKHADAAAESWWSCLHWLLAHRQHHSFRAWEYLLAMDKRNNLVCSKQLSTGISTLCVKDYKVNTLGSADH